MSFLFFSCKPLWQQVTAFDRMPHMKRWVWIMGLWLVGIGSAHALDLKAAETLRYRLYWGPVTVGDARLDYRVDGDRYTVQAEVVDDSSLIDLHDVWQTTGRHTKARAFVPDEYKVRQAENSYRADKSMVFDRTVGKVVYTNRLDASDKGDEVVVSEARDVLSTVYVWRLATDAEVIQAARIPMVSMKREVVLERKAGVKDRVQHGGKTVAAWRVEMRVIKNGKPSKDTWTVFVSDDVRRIPLKIVARTKFGTFNAILKP
jgi:Protein of unknown function (DUF3108)